MRISVIKLNEKEIKIYTQRLTYIIHIRVVPCTCTHSTHYACDLLFHRIILFLLRCSALFLFLFDLLMPIKYVI